MVVVLLGVFIISCFVFRQYYFGHKILFPANLLVSTYAPWKYEPVPEYPNGPPNKPIGFDDARQFYPNRKLLRDSLRSGIIALWNPYIYSGTPFMAAFDTAVWYPLSWIAALLPVIEGWNFLVIIQPILSMLFMYVFLKSLKFEPAIAAYGAFVWAFAGFMVVYFQEILVLEHSFLWLPLALYASNRLWEHHADRFGFVLLVLALTCSVFAGFLQMSIYVYGIVVIWNIYRSISERRLNIWIPVAVILSLLMACIQLVPSIEAFLGSPRGTEDGLTTFQNALLPGSQVITLIAPDFWGNPATYNYFGGAGFYFEKIIFIGVIPLALSLYAMGEWRKKRILFWTFIAVIALSMGFALPTSWLPYNLHIPVLANSYPTRIFGIWAFAATILSCYGLSSFMKVPRYKRVAFVMSGLTILLLSGWIVVVSAWCVYHKYPAGVLWCRGKLSVPWDIVGHIPAIYKDKDWYAGVALRNLIVPSVFVIAGWMLMIIRKFFSKITFVFVCIVAIASCMYFAQKYIYVSERRFVYPDVPVIGKISSITGFDRIWGYGNAFLEKNIAQYYGWFSTDGYGNLSSSRYAELLSTIPNDGKLGGAVRRSDTDMNEIPEQDLMSANPYRLRIMSLLGVHYILESKKGVYKDSHTAEERFPSELFSRFWENDSWRIWQYKHALPRVIFASNYIVKNSDQDIVDALYDPHTNLETTIVLEKSPGIMLPVVSEAKTSAEIISYHMNDITIRTDADTDGFVFLPDNYDPGWQAFVDGKRGSVLRADYSFKAVFVPKGTHVVIFKYLPLSVMIGSVVSICGFIVLGIMCFRIRDNDS